MTATSTPASARIRPAQGRPWLAAARLLRLEVRRNAMMWLSPVAIALFWLIAYRKIMAMPPLWYVRATSMQTYAVVTFACPVAGTAAWMGAREARRHTTELVSITPRPRWARLLATWAATTCWALAAYLACLAIVYGVTAQQATWGGPLWWPATVAATSLPAVSALGFAAGALIPGRFTAPLTALAAFFALALSTQLIVGGNSYWQISPVVAYPWDTGPDPGVATFYPYLPDLPSAQVIFLAGLTVAALGTLALASSAGRRWLLRPAAAVTAAGLLAAATAVALAGTGQLDAHGMIAIPVLHDAASDRPLRYTPACSHTAIPVCLNPAFASYLPAVAAALKPILNEIAGLPGAPVRISQAAVTYRQGPGNSVSMGIACPPGGGTQVYRMLLPDQLPEPPMTTNGLTSAVRSETGPGIVASVTGDGPGASAAQHAVTTALLIAAGVVPRHLPPSAVSPAAGSKRAVPPRVSSAATRPLPACTGTQPPLGLPTGSPGYEAAQRFAALPGAARHAWLDGHLAALRAGRISLGQLP